MFTALPTAFNSGLPMSQSERHLFNTARRVLPKLFNGRLTERGAGHQLAGYEHLKVKPEPALARHRIRAVRHEPQHPFGADTAPESRRLSGSINGTLSTIDAPLDIIKTRPPGFIGILSAACIPTSPALTSVFQAVENSS
jgi:hypothetical protein